MMRPISSARSRSRSAAVCRIAMRRSIGVSRQIAKPSRGRVEGAVEVGGRRPAELPDHLPRWPGSRRARVRLPLPCDHSPVDVHEAGIGAGSRASVVGVWMGGLWRSAATGSPSVCSGGTVRVVLCVAVGPQRPDVVGRGGLVDPGLVRVVDPVHVGGVLDPAAARRVDEPEDVRPDGVPAEPPRLAPACARSCGCRPR